MDIDDNFFFRTQIVRKMIIFSSIPLLLLYWIKLEDFWQVVNYYAWEQKMQDSYVIP